MNSVYLMKLDLISFEGLMVLTEIVFLLEKYSNTSFTLQKIQTKFNE